MSKIRLVEMGPRDGLQNESKTLSVEARVEFVEKLIGCGITNVETGAFVSPKWVPQMVKSLEVLKTLRDKQKSGAISKSVRLMTLVPNEQGFEDAIKADAEEIAVFTAASEAFSKKNTNATIKESFERIKVVAKLAKKNKIKVRGYISTCWYCPFEGKIAESKVVKIAEQLEDIGVYEISVGDTIGAATPNEVRSLNKKLIKSVGAKKLAMHFHDTRGTALANILASLDLGISTFDSSLGGLGGCPYAPGAAGNVATEDVVYMLHGMGLKTGYNLEKLQEVSKWMAPLLSRTLKGARPFKTQS